MKCDHIKRPPVCHGGAVFLPPNIPYHRPDEKSFCRKKPRFLQIRRSRQENSPRRSEAATFCRAIRTQRSVACVPAEFRVSCGRGEKRCMTKTPGRCSGACAWSGGGPSGRRRNCWASALRPSASGSGARAAGRGDAAAPCEDFWRQRGGNSGRRPASGGAGWRKYEKNTVLRVPGLRQHSDSCGGRAACLRGRRLEPLEVRSADPDHAVTVQEVEEDWYVTFRHPMDKGHYIRFTACVTPDRLLLARLYPEQGSEFRIPSCGAGRSCTFAAPATGCSRRSCREMAKERTVFDGPLF